jgi:excinuclease ABC subunit C
MTIKERLQDVPKKPGSYQMFDDHDRVIYVGKAKNLKARLTSYFTGSHDHKTTKLVSNIHRFEYIVTNTEIEALILELDLIKKYQPRYNVLLRDDKSYPYIEITQEKNPKLQVTRRVSKKNKRVFGPYPNAKAARDTLKILNQIYPLRKCQTLPNEPCLYYHIGQCLAPCIKPIPKETYDGIITEITRFLKGDIKPVMKTLEEKMHTASENLAFERALEYKEAMESIKVTTEKQAINLNDLKDRDIIGFSYDEAHIALEFFFIRGGKINARDSKILTYYGDPLDDALKTILQFYDFYPVPKELLILEPSFKETLETLLQVPVVIPQRGPKKSLLNVALENAKETLRVEKNKTDREYEKTYGALEELSELIGIPVPYRIEAFDNSHIKGEYPVSGMVVYQNGKPDRNSYRKYKLETSGHQKGDTEQLEEVLYRRYQRMLMDDLKRPDLIVVDGGIHQLNTTRKILEGLNLNIPFIGLAKSKDHKTEYLLDQDGNTFELKKNTALFRLLAGIQEEVHRFTITFHQTIRDKGLFDSVLSRIEGVGPVTRKKLLETFKSTKNIKEASPESLKALGIGDKTIDALKKTLGDLS